MGKKLKCFIFVILLFPPVLHSQTLRPSLWIYNYVDYLQHRGAMWNLSPLERPYTVNELIKEIGRTAADSGKRKGDRGSRKPGQKNKRVDLREWMWRFLREMPNKDQDVLLWLQSGNEYFNGEIKNQYAGKQRGTVGMRVMPWLEVYNTFVLDNRLDEMPSYLGKTQSGYASYSEQAYILAYYKQIHLKIGRDFIYWGPGQDAALMFSDYSRPLDQISVSYSSKYFSFIFFTASLDPTHYPVVGERIKTNLPQNRYLSAHRLEIRPWKYLYIGFSEAILFGGPGVSYDLAYLNPVLFYHGVQLNGPVAGNTVGSISFSFMPKQNVNLYGELLIDDIQIEKSGPGDLEPNEVGYIYGANVADPFDVFGLDVYGEYTRITNRTFNGQGGPWEKWLHRNQPIGHFLGNDFDRILAGFSYWPLPRYRVALQYEKRRRGEGRIEKAFDTPWKNTPLGQNYSEPFPTGIVEESGIFSLNATWQPKWWLRVLGAGTHWDIQNLDNRLNVSNSFWEWRVGVNFDIVHTWKIPR